MDATKPTDTDLISALPAYIREARAAINALSAGSGVGVTEYEIPAGTISLTVGTDVGRFGYELLILTSDGAAVSLEHILGGVQGQVKTIVFRDNNVSFVDGLANDGHLYLNQPPVGSVFTGQLNDSITLVNIGGDGGSTTHGFWKEVSRQIALK